MPKTFGAWLKAQQERNDPVGDLARDFIDACRWMKNDPMAMSPGSVTLQMACLNACSEAYEALDAAAAEWEGSR